MDPAAAHVEAWIEAVAALPGGRLRREGGVVWSQTQIAWPMFNGAIAIPALGSCDAAPAAAQELASLGVPWFWWALPDTPPEVLEAAGAAGASAFDHEAPWMEAQRASLPRAEVPPDVRIAEVQDEAGHREWAATLRAIYEFPEAGERAWVQSAERCGWDRVPWRRWIAYADDRPAGVALLFCGGGVASLFGVGTLPEFRRRGIGRLLTLHPLEHADEPLAAFFSTESGDPLYRSLGFTPRGFVSRWLGGFERPAEIAAARGATTRE